MLLMQLDESNIMINLAVAERNDRPDVFITAPEGTTVDDLGKRWTGSAWEDVPVPEPPPPEPTELDKINEKLGAHSQLLLQLGMASIAPPAPEEIPQAPTVPGHPDPTGLPPVPDDMTLDSDLLLGLMDTPPTPPELP